MYLYVLGVVSKVIIGENKMFVGKGLCTRVKLKWIFLTSHSTFWKDSNQGCLGLVVKIEVLWTIGHKFESPLPFFVLCTAFVAHMDQKNILERFKLDMKIYLEAFPRLVKTLISIKKRVRCELLKISERSWCACDYTVWPVTQKIRWKNINWNKLQAGRLDKKIHI